MWVTLLIVALVWAGLTLWVEKKGPARMWQYGKQGKTALVVYDADPLYNLDEELCRAFADTLAQNNIQATVATVKAMENLPRKKYDLYMLCANTYNWSPDWAITRFARQYHFKGQKVALLTIGSGSTDASKRKFEEVVKGTGADIIGSKTLWLMRPNDESRMEEANVAVAISITKQWAGEIATQLD